MRTPNSFQDFTRQFHQDVELVHPGCWSDDPDARNSIYEDFKELHGKVIVDELAAFFHELIDSPDIDLEKLWNKFGKSDFILKSEGVQNLIHDFLHWSQHLGENRS